LRVWSFGNGGLSFAENPIRTFAGGVDFPIGYPITEGCDAGLDVLTGSTIAFDRYSEMNSGLAAKTIPFPAFPARRVLPMQSRVSGHLFVTRAGNGFRG
jgi:hypothetical protein